MYIKLYCSFNLRNFLKSNDSGLETGERRIFSATSQLSLHDITHVWVERCSIHIWSVLCQSKPIYKYHEKCSKNLSGNSHFVFLRIPQKIPKYLNIFLKISFCLNVFSSKSSKNSHKSHYVLKILNIIGLFVSWPMPV